MMTPHDAVALPDYRRLPPDEMLARASAFQARVAQRRSVRAFSAEPVDRAIIEAAIRAAGTAPSGANHQPWHFACIGSAALKREIRLGAEAEERAFYGGKAPADWIDALAPLGTDASKPYLESAPWLIAIFAQRRGGIRAGDDRKNYYIAESVGIATGIAITALHVAGLATLTHTPNPMTFLNRLCGRPSSEKPYLLLVAGFPAADATVPAHALVKKPLQDISSWL
jgi:iodotyrosine deiodinase